MAETMEEVKAKPTTPPKKKGTTIPKGTTGEELARQISKDLAKAGTGKGLEADVIGSIVGKSISKVIVKKNRVGKSSRGIVRYKPDKGTQPASDRPLMSAVGSAISTGDTGDTSVPTIGQVATFGEQWGGSEKTISTSNPTSGDGDNGDFWFVREA